MHEKCWWYSHPRWQYPPILLGNTTSAYVMAQQNWQKLSHRYTTKNLPNINKTDIIFFAWPAQFIAGEFLIICITLRMKQNGDNMSNTFSCIQMFVFSFKLHWTFFPRGTIKNKQSLFQVMVWYWTGDKPLSEPMMASLLMHISMPYCKKDVTPLLMHWSYVFLALTHHRYASLSFNDLISRPWQK